MMGGGGDVVKERKGSRTGEREKKRESNVEERQIKGDKGEPS